MTTPRPKLPPTWLLARTALVAQAALCALAVGRAWAADPRLLEVAYDPAQVITLATKRGHVTHIELADDEVIQHVASGQGAVCTDPDMTWCIQAEAGERNVFVKPRASARRNTVSVVTDKRSYTFDLAVLPENSKKEPALRVTVRAGQRASAANDPQRAAELATLRAAELRAALADKAEREARLATFRARLKANPEPQNTQYTVAVGDASDDIVPSLAYDDGRFTYMRFPGNREVPAVFQVDGSGQESIVNARMSDDLLVVDRVAPKLYLRRGRSVVAVINEAFDAEGHPPEGGSTRPGIERVLTAQEEATPWPR